MTIHDIYRVMGRSFRRRRMAHFLALFDVDDETQVVDIGGTPGTWRGLPYVPRVRLVNVDPLSPETLPANISYSSGDGRDLPFLESQSADIAFSNSTIEHVGSYEDQHAFATEMRRIGRGYYCQTPARCFIIEPHLLTPAIHWLPPRIQRRLIRRFTVWGWITRPSQECIDAFVNTTRLLKYRECQELFPDAEVARERVLGLTKSYVIMKRVPR